MIKRILTLCLAMSIVFSTLTSFSLSASAESLQTEVTIIHEYCDESISGYNTSLTYSKSTQRWSSPSYTYIFNKTDSTFSVFDASDTDIYVDTYKSDTYELTGRKKIDRELNLFGGFYAGKNINYVVFGQTNSDENNSAEVMRLVRYDADFNRIDSLSIKNCYTHIPFDAGSLRMAENEKGELVIHTARERYLTSDGLHHQSQLTVVVDTDTMTVKNNLGEFQSNHVSHSFNQFAQYDGDNHVLVDHGDAYPRSVVLNKYDGSRYSSIDLFNIPGATGANCTGITVGGFEISQSSYLVPINTIDHSKVTAYDSFNMTGLDKDERDIVLLVSSKDNNITENVKQIKLTDYVDKNKSGSTPYLVKINNDKFVVMWEEYVYNQNSWESNGVKYVCVDGNGNATSKIFHAGAAHLSKDCQPVVVGDKIIYFVNTSTERTFYEIDLEYKHTTCTFDQNEVKSSALKSPATSSTLAVYYKSCLCGKVSTNNADTFEYSGPIELFNFHKVGVGISSSSSILYNYSVGKSVSELLAFRSSELTSWGYSSYTLPDGKTVIPNGGSLFFTHEGVSYDFTLINVADVNNDYKVNSSDALYMLKHSVGSIEITGVNFISGDLDGSGTITSIDALLALKISVGHLAPETLELEKS